MIDHEGSIVLAEIHSQLSAHPEEVGVLNLHSDHLTATHGKHRLVISVQVHADPDLHQDLAHAHAVVETDEGDLSGHLNACVIGTDPDRAAALKQTARSWVEAVAGPIFSLLHARPVLGADHFDGTDPGGVSGTHGFAGPLILRLSSEKFPAERLLDRPLFDFAPELAPAGVIHLAKATLGVKEGRWQRTIEVDGHQAAYVDAAWDAGMAAPQQVVASRFAVFHYADRPEFVTARRLLDEIIREYVKVFDHERDLQQTAQKLIQAGYPANIVDRVDHFLTLALGRALITSSLPFQPNEYYHRVLPSGELRRDNRLLHEPAYARGLMLADELARGPYLDAVKNLALYSAEVHAVNSLLNAGSRLEDCRSAPFLIPDFDTSGETFTRAVREALQPAPEPPKKAPWWKLW